MLLSIALVILFGRLFDYIFKAMHLPGLMGMIIIGIILGPHGLSFLDPALLDHASDLQKIALVVILMRAGLGLNIEKLKQSGRAAFLMCFVPATLEMLGVILLARPLLGFSWQEAALLGTVLAAVSPAVVVPRMLKLKNEGYAAKHGIPQLILASSSADDVFVIVMFTAMLGIMQGNDISALSIANIPFSIVAGIALGALVGWLLTLVFRRFKMSDVTQMLVSLCAALLLVAFQDKITLQLTYSAYIAIMAMGIPLQKFCPDDSKALSTSYNRLWITAETFLFVLVGASVPIEYAANAGLATFILIAGALVFRMVGVFFSVTGTPFTRRERLFCMIAYTPKATVQAAIGGLPLAAGLACGTPILCTAVIAILVTAPLGAFAIDLSCPKLLEKDEENNQ